MIKRHFVFCGFLYYIAFRKLLLSSDNVFRNELLMPIGSKKLRSGSVPKVMVFLFYIQQSDENFFGAKKVNGCLRMFIITIFGTSGSPWMYIEHLEYIGPMVFAFFVKTSWNRSKVKKEINLWRASEKCSDGISKWKLVCSEDVKAFELPPRWERKLL